MKHTTTSKPRQYMAALRQAYGGALDMGTLAAFIEQYAGVSELFAPMKDALALDDRPEIIHQWHKTRTALRCIPLTDVQESRTWLYGRWFGENAPAAWTGILQPDALAH